MFSFYESICGFLEYFLKIFEYSSHSWDRFETSPILQAFCLWNIP